MLTDPDTMVLDLELPLREVDTEPRYYGITPSTLVLALTSVALVVGVVLFALGRWPFGLLVLGIAVLLGLVFRGANRRRPDSVARSAAEKAGVVKARAGLTAGSLATRGRATGQVLALRRELERLRPARTRLLVDLGEAVYGGDEHGSERARLRLQELDELAARKEAEMQAVVADAQEQLRLRRLEFRRARMVEEPAEPPDEGDPAAPAVIPEPYPPPDEGSPPGPAIIPEPSPAVIPEPGPIDPEERA